MHKLLIVGCFSPPIQPGYEANSRPALISYACITNVKCVLFLLILMNNGT